jgi:hypothetical protein
VIEKIHPDLRHLAEPIETLELDPENANTHDRRSLETIASMFIDFGQRKPLVGRLSTRTIEAGNGALEALRLAGWTHLAVIWCDDDDTRAKAYALGDNQSARLSDWAPLRLQASLEELLAEGYDIGVIGWSSVELDALMSGTSKSSTPTTDPSPTSDEAGSSTGSGSGSDASPQLSDKLVFQLLVTCSCDVDQAELLERLESDGYVCKPMVAQCK